MVDPSISALRAFVAVGEFTHFAHAASSLNMTAPALSQQIRRLEEQLGTELFVRSSRQVSITDAGRNLLPLAREVVSSHDRVRRWAKEQNEPVLRVGFVHVGAPAQLTHVFSAVQHRRPGTRIEMRHVYRDSIERALADAEVDAAFLWGPRHSSRVESRVLAVADRALILNSADFSRRFGDVEGPLELEQLSDLDFIALSSIDKDFTNWVLANPRPGGLQARRGQMARSIDEAFAMVAAGVGAFIVPVPVAQAIQHEDVSWRPIVDASLAYFSVFIPDTPSSQATAWLLELLDEFFPGTSVPDAVTFTSS